MLGSFVVCALFLCAISPLAFAQQYHYVSTTDGKSHDIMVTKEKRGNHDVLTLEEYKLHSQHTFDAGMGTKQWALRDDKSHHHFVAKRNGDRIQISGTFQGEPVNKEVAIDDQVWFNKLDHGLSAFAASDQQEMSFWVLKLLSDLDPIKMTAEKEKTERIQVGDQFYEAVRIKLVIDHFILSKLWSAQCWYRASDGLFLRYKGANGRPGTPVTTINLMKQVVDSKKE